MKMKKILFLSMLLMISMISCEHRYQRKNSKLTLKEAPIKRNSRTKDKSSNNMPKEKEVYQGMLNAFCVKYYNDKFDEEYQNGSLTVDLVDTEFYQDNKTAVVKGVHSYNNKNAVPFMATITRLDKETYKITFEQAIPRGDNTTQNFIYME